jgi:hypothetical protein
MAPSNLQGLNIVHQAPPQNPYLSDQDLLSVPPFPDLSAQLDLWTNLNFQSDEPLVSRKGDHSEKRSGSVSASEDDGDRYNLADDDLHSTGKVAETHAHENVVTGTVVPPAPVPTPAGTGLPQLPPIDIGNLLAGFGIDPFQMPSLPSVPAPAASASVPSLAQLLSYHSLTGLPSLNLPGASSPSSATQQPAPTMTQQSASASTTTQPATKRARTSRASVSAEQSSPEVSSPTSPDVEGNSASTPLNAAEDKRRRNTAASARFRLKKKEREAALEKKAKELEVRVGELEKECEALRRENGWLKGLVVGVTGAGAVQQQAAVSAGAKRTRDDGDEKGQI